MTERKIKGLTSELLCQYYLTSLGYNVSIPLGEDCKYDMIADFDGILTRIQVKHCSAGETGITISISSTSLKSNGIIKRSYSKNDIDFFATFYNGRMYMIPVEECGNTTKKLSFEISKYAASNACLISDYEAEIQIDKIVNGEVFNEHHDDKKITQYDLKGNQIAIFNSLSEITNALGIRRESATHISQVCNGKRKTAYGYIWKYS